MAPYREQKRKSSMFPSREDRARYVKQAVKGLVDFGMPVQLSLIIRRIKIEHPELKLERYQPGAIKQAVYKIVGLEGIELEQAKK